MSFILVLSPFSFVFFFFIFNVNVNINASEVITVTAEKIEKDLSVTTSSVIVIDQAEIENSGKSSLADLIRTKAGIYLNSNGGVGKTTSLFIRGGASSYVQIIIDGVKVNDPTLTSSQVDLAHLDLTNIQKVEILKGSESVLYGSDALSGIIKITSKKASLKKETNGNLSLGSYKYRAVGMNTSQTQGKISYSLGANHRELEGFSSYNDEEGSSYDKDGYSNLTASLSLEYKLSKLHKVSLQTRFIKSSSEFDTSTADKREYFEDNNHSQYALIHEGRFLNDLILAKTQMSLKKNSRRVNSFKLSFFEAETKKVEELITFLFSEKETLLLGLEHEAIQADSVGNFVKKLESTSAIFLSNSYTNNFFFSDQGLRLTKHNSFGEELVYKVGVGRKIQGLESVVKVNYATGFKAPSLYERHGDFGNTSLQPTKSKSFDLSLLSNSFLGDLEITYFNNLYKNEIDTRTIGSSTQYVNVGKSHTYGVELSLKTSPMRELFLAMTATWLRAYNKSVAGKSTYLARRPRFQFHTEIDYQATEKIKVTFKMTSVGERENSDFDELVLPAYQKSDLSLIYLYDKSLRYQLSVNNVFNKKYVEVSGYSTASRNILLNIKVDL